MILFSLLSTEWIKCLLNSKLLWMGGKLESQLFGAVKSRTKTILPGHAGIQVSYKKWNTRVQVQVLSFSARAAEVVKKKHAL